MSKMFGVRRGLIEVCEGMDYLVKKEGKGKIRQIITTQEKRKEVSRSHLPNLLGYLEVNGYKNKFEVNYICT